jgi:hypothetical protein
VIQHAADWVSPNPFRLQFALLGTSMPRANGGSSGRPPHRSRNIGAPQSGRRAGPMDARTAAVDEPSALGPPRTRVSKMVVRREHPHARIMIPIALRYRADKVKFQSTPTNSDFRLWAGRDRNHWRISNGAPKATPWEGRGCVVSRTTHHDVGQLWQAPAGNPRIARIVS